MAISGPKHPITNMPAAIAITTNEIARVVDDEAHPLAHLVEHLVHLAVGRLFGRRSRAGAIARTIATEPMSPADTRKLTKSIA